MWSGQSLLTKHFPHWETNFACLNNFRVKNVFSSLLPTLFSIKTMRTAVGARFIREASMDPLHQDPTTFTGLYYEERLLPEVMVICVFKKKTEMSLFQGISFKRKIPVLKQTYAFWISINLQREKVTQKEISELFVKSFLKIKIAFWFMYILLHLNDQLCTWGKTSPLPLQNEGVRSILICSTFRT